MVLTSSTLNTRKASRNHRQEEEKDEITVHILSYALTKGYQS
jgi:hypothetical protein